MPAGLLYMSEPSISQNRFNRRLRRKGKKQQQKAALYKAQPKKKAENKVADDLAVVKTKVNKISRQFFAVQKRFQDITYTARAISTTANVQLMNGLVIGDTNGTRDGTQILMKQLEYRFSILSGDATNLIRIIVVVDKQSDSTTFSMGELLAVGTDPNSVYLWYEKPRFQILSDKSYALDSVAQPIVITGLFKNFNIPANYGSTNAGDITDLDRGALFIVMLSDSSAAPHVTVNGYARLVYIP